jgi:hypothetical protein
MPKTTSTLPNLSPSDPRVTEAVVKRIKEMSIDELQACLSRRPEGIVERQFPDPSPTSRQELLSKRK